MTTKSTEIQTSFLDILNNLTEKEKIIISRRIWLNWEKETLQEIWNDYSITRERVRQIEDVWTKKIWRIIKTTKLLKIQEAWEKLLELHGWLLTKDKLVSAVINELKIDSPINPGIIEVILQSDFNINKSKPQLGTKTFFFFPAVNKKAIAEIHKEALKILKKKGDIIETTSLYEMIKINLFSTFGKLDNILIDSVLDVFTDIVKWEEKYGKS